MPGFLEALENTKPLSKKHMVIIQGKQVEVSLEKKLEIIRVGESNYMLQGKNIVLIPAKKTPRVFPVLKQQDIDPYWIKTQEEIEWVIE